MSTFFEKLEKAKHLRLDEGVKRAMRTRLVFFMYEKSKSNGKQVTFFPFFATHARAVAFASVLFVVAGASTSFAAEGTVPGDVLYPVKVHVNEEVRGLLAVTSEAKTQWEVERATRRLKEAATLASKGKLNAQVTLELNQSFNSSVDKMSAGVREMRKENQVDAAATITSRFEASLSARKKILQALEGQTTSSEKESDIASVRNEIAATLGAVSKTRVELENEITSPRPTKEGKNTGIQDKAKEKLDGATALLNAVRSELNDGRSSLGASAAREIDMRLSAADGLLSESSHQLEKKSYSDAFNSASKALRAAERARVLLHAEEELYVNVLAPLLRSSTTDTLQLLEGGDDDEGDLSSHGDVSTPTATSSTQNKNDHTREQPFRLIKDHKREQGSPARE